MKYDYKKIKNLRMKHEGRPSQSRIAMDVLGYTDHTMYSKIENGKADISLAGLEKLAKFYGVDMSAFFEFDGSEVIGRDMDLRSIENLILKMESNLHSRLDRIHSRLDSLQRECDTTKDWAEPPKITRGGISKR